MRKALARQSIKKKDSISVESQLEYCRYETHGEACIKYTDKGFSGKATNRPGFENMMEIFQKYHVEFVSSTEKFDTSTPIGRAMLNFKKAKCPF